MSPSDAVVCSSNLLDNGGICKEGKIVFKTYNTKGNNTAPESSLFSQILETQKSSILVNS